MWINCGIKSADDQQKRKKKQLFIALAQGLNSDGVGINAAFELLPRDALVAVILITPGDSLVVN